MGGKISYNQPKQEGAGRQNDDSLTPQMVSRFGANSQMG